MKNIKKYLIVLLLMLSVLFLGSDKIIAADTITVNHKNYSIFQQDGAFTKVVQILKTKDKNELVFCLNPEKTLPSASDVLTKKEKETTLSAKDSAILVYITNSDNIKKYITRKGTKTNEEHATDYKASYPSDTYINESGDNAIQAKKDGYDYELDVKKQLAVWYYLCYDQEKCSIPASSSDSDIRNRIDNTYSGFGTLIEKAKTNANTPTTPSDLKVTLTGDTKMTIEDEYYVSNLITVTSTDTSSKIKLTVSSSNLKNIIIEDKDGKNLSNNWIGGTPVEVTSGTQIRIKVAETSVPIGDATITLKATSSKTNTSYAVYEYAAEDTKIQTVAKVEEVNAEEKADASMTFSLSNKTSVVISKLDVTGKEEVPGATLQLLDSKKQTMTCTIDNKESKDCSWVSGTKPVEITNIPAGDYYLKEITAPNSYVLNEEIVKVTVKANETVKSSMTNKKTLVRISKLDSTKQRLEGAHLQIEDKDGNIVKYCTDKKGNKNTECKWISTKDVYEIEGMPNGTYYLVETKAPDFKWSGYGYELNKKPVSFVVDGKKDVVEVEMVNILKPVVPSTSSNRSALYITIGMILISSGVGILVYTKKRKNNI